MPHGSSPDERHNYLVRARSPATLALAVAFMESDPSFTLVRRLGPRSEPHTLVVSMTESAAALLAQRFADELIVERDRPLTPFWGD